MSREDLSRLLEGDVDEAERERLLAQIASDPEARAAWELLQGLPARFEPLRRVPPPPDLDRRVLAATGRRWPSLRALVPWGLVAATVAGALLLRPDPVEVTVLAGTQEVEGRAVVHAGDVVVDVDGDVRISREPAARSARGTGSGGPMKPQAVVTVAVLGGSAVVWAADGAPTELSAGQVTTIGHPAKPPAVGPVPAPGPSSREAELEAENALLRSMMEQMETEWHGTPIPWPAGLPEPLTPSGFERTARKAVEQCAPSLEIVGFDCSEPPCLVELRSKEPGPLDPFGHVWDDLVNTCPTWVDAYTSSVTEANGQATCPDGRTESYLLLGESAGLAPPDGYTKEQQENQGKRFQARIDEIQRSWRCR